VTFTIQEAATVAGVTVATIMNWIKKKKLKASHLRRYAIEGTDLRDLLVKRDTK